MMKNKDIIVIPFNLPWDWSTDYTNQTAFELAKRGNIVICYLWADAKSIKESIVSGKCPKLITKYSKNIYLFNPIYFIPFRRFKFIADTNSLINIFLLRVFTELVSMLRRTEKKIFWIFNPNLIFIYKYFSKKYFLLYDCVDFFAFDNKENITRTKLNERFLCKMADLVVANSHVLQKHLSQYRTGVKLVPQGFRIADFQKKRGKIRNFNFKKPIVGYVGAINARLDCDLLLNLARGNPDWNFVVWGPVLEKEKINQKTRDKIQRLFSLPNVKTGQSKDKREIPGIISQFDIGMIPYNASYDFNKYCYPAKLFEYFYMGIPVISTPIEELSYFKDLVFTAKGDGEWQKCIKKTLSSPWSPTNKAEQKQVAVRNSWKNKIEAIYKAIAKNDTQPVGLTGEFLKQLPLGFIFATEVASESMEPLLQVGCLVRVRRAGIEQVNTGDIIMFINTDYHYPAVHRVIKRVKRNSRILLFTKGDNAPRADIHPVKQTSFIGVVVQKLNDQGGYEDLVVHN